MQKRVDTKKVTTPHKNNDLPYKALVANTNAIPAKSDENQVIDESYWPHCGYGESGSGICQRLYQNKNFSMCGPIVLCMDDGRSQICAYMHRHKLYKHKKQVWSDVGPYEIYILQCALL